MILKNYKIIIKDLKSIILASRYRAAALANKELLVLYFSVGKLISDKTREGEWGTGILEKLSEDLQNELPGLRGFSSPNLRKIRLFYEAWSKSFSIRSTVSNKLLTVTAKKNISSKLKLKSKNPIRSTLSNELEIAFLSLSFSHHSEILSKVKDIEERKFYIAKSSAEY